MSLQPKFALLFCFIILPVVSPKSSSTPHLDYSFGSSMTDSPSIRSFGPAPLTIDLAAANHSLPELLVLNITTSDINCTDDKCFAYIKYDGNEIWRKQVFSTSVQEVFTTSLVVRTPGRHSVTISTSDNLKWTIERLSLNKKEFAVQSRGVSYSPFRDCQSPGGIEPSMSEVDYDLEMLSHVSQAIRTYSSTGVQQHIPKMAKRRGLTGVRPRRDVASRSML